MTMGASALALGGGGELAATAPDLVAARFPAPRRVLSDAAWNGGWREACAAANHLMRAAAIDSAAAHATYCRQILVRHHLPPDTPLQLTAAPVTGGGCCQQLVDGVRVTAYVSAGVRHNAVWAGDAAQYRERTEAEYVPLPPGTINAILCIDARLADAAFPHVFTVVAEAKGSLLRACGVRSCYSRRLATGTGTDSTTVIADPAAARAFSTASTHSELGMTIARTFRAALAEALRNDNLAPRHRTHATTAPAKIARSHHAF